MYVRVFNERKCKYNHGVSYMRVPRATSRDPYGKIITPRDVRLYRYRSKYGPGITWYILHDSSRGRLLYSNLPNFLRGMNGINPIVYGDRTGGTCDFYRMGHDSSFWVLVCNNETPYLYLLFGVLRKTRTGIYCRIGHFSREIH